MKRFLLALVLVPLSVLAMEPSGVPDLSLESFGDYDQIPQYARTPIEVLIDKGILTGDGNGNFAPSREINRAEFAKLVVEASLVKKYTPLEPSFIDVSPTDWFYTYVETAKREGWIAGYPDGLFRPAEQINRAEIAKILTLAFDFSISQSHDDRYWYDPYVRALAERKLLPFNTQHATFIPAKRPDRAEVSEHIYKVMAYTGQINADEFDVAYLHGDPAAPASDAAFEPSVETEGDEVEEETENPFEGREITEYTPEKTAEVEFEYHDPNALQQSIEPRAGKLYVDKPTAPRRTTVFPGQDNVELLRLTFRGQEGVTKIHALQFRLNGNAGPDMYRRVWLSINGRIYSPRVAPPVGAVVTLPLTTTLELRDQEISVRLVGEVSEDLVDGDTARAVLFLPEWIESNTDKKIGFFPFGGPDVTVSE